MKCASNYRVIVILLWATLVLRPGIDGSATKINKI